MTITAEQRALRVHGIGSSDAPIVAGVSPWKTPLALWMEKIDGVTDIGETLPMRFGNALEDVIANEWARQNGKRVVLSPDTYYDETSTILFAHPDRFVEDEPEGLEVKYVAAYSDDWGIPGTDQVPAHVAFQCLHSMMVTKRERWNVAVCNAFYEFRSYVVPRVDDLIEKLRDRELAFWSLVEARIPPPMMSAADVRLMYPKDSGKDVFAPADIIAEVEHLKFLRRERDSIAELEEQTIGHIQEYMGEHSRLIDRDGKVLATWTTPRAGERVDLDALRRDAPSIARRFTIKVPGSRRFLIK
jgi:putative phage-type endonuclease